MLSLLWILTKQDLNRLILLIFYSSDYRKSFSSRSRSSWSESFFFVNMSLFLLLSLLYVALVRITHPPISPKLSLPYIYLYRNRNIIEPLFMFLLSYLLLCNILLFKTYLNPLPNLKCFQILHRINRCRSVRLVSPYTGSSFFWINPLPLAVFYSESCASSKGRFPCSLTCLYLHAQPFSYLLYKTYPVYFHLQINIYFVHVLFVKSKCEVFQFQKKVLMSFNKTLSVYSTGCKPFPSFSLSSSLLVVLADMRDSFSLLSLARLDLHNKAPTLDSNGVLTLCKPSHLMINNLGFLPFQLQGHLFLFDTHPLYLTNKTIITLSDSINLTLLLLNKSASTAEKTCSTAYICTVTVHQSLVESILENGWSNDRSFLGVSEFPLLRRFNVTSSGSLWLIFFFPLYPVLLYSPTYNNSFFLVSLFPYISSHSSPNCKGSPNVMNQAQEHSSSIGYRGALDLSFVGMWFCFSRHYHNCWCLLYYNLSITGYYPPNGYFIDTSSIHSPIHSHSSPSVLSTVAQCARS
ncbi:hypothetical protein VP01_337g2 [Puccinia sorghi]|uniref:Uncharacterized protein n=1 Tax=Puccinia sorghi TaxID=27349 RepID=A0A0L6UYN0_9BASI|nr:hypothetical protein VP01_337g2 [Puccinia sorghi]